MILKKDSDNEMDYISNEDKMRLAFAELLNQQGVDTGVDVDEVLDEKIKEAKYGEDFDNTLDALNYSLKSMEDYIMKEPDYYASNGLSPIGAFKKGLMSREQYTGFIIGNIIKYVVRAESKEDPVKDLNKAKDYINFYLELLTDENQTERPEKYGHYELAKREDIYEKSRELMEKALDGLNNIRDVDCNV
ncbi:MAG: DUF3310 domain-containing protein [Methanobrevibacter sp.]|nr:DUF3310 domain-containing protein [Methanobrevibacter sp.]